MSGKGKIFILDDDELILSMLTRILEKEGYKVFPETETREVVNKIKMWSPDVLLLDIRLPDKSGIEILREIYSSGIETEVIMLTADDTAESAVKAMKFGAVDYLTKPFNIDKVKIVIKNSIEKEKLKQEVAYLRKVYSETFNKDLIGDSEVIKELRTKIEKMAEACVSTVFISGESGTGKEVIARNIHRLMYTSHNQYAPFISINCAAMPESILESELFGYEKGSFTDAKSDKKGLFEMADGGSILLDEIGDMKTDLQSKLLRVLEERTIRPIGGKEEIPVELTVLATTNKNITEAVKQGEFRQDLFYRLSTFYLHIPPLRERREDVPILLKHFISIFSKQYNIKNIREFSPDAVQRLMSYEWPGNVRELKNLVERFVVLENTEVIHSEHLPAGITNLVEERDQSSNKIFSLPDSGISLEEVEKDFIRQAMEKANHNKTHAARLLDISYDTLRYQLKKYGIK